LGGATGRAVVAEGVRSSRVSSVVVGRGVDRRVLVGIWAARRVAGLASERVAA
jgi:hypothetical protein